MIPLAPKCQVYNWLYAWDFDKDIDMFFFLLQSEINQQVPQIADLQENLKSQQAETTKAKDEL